ncbi:hypothetical protein JCM16303_003443 [Sporobolomyces ruberrimus]
MNHLYHTLSPLVLYAAFLVSLLGFLAPTPIFPDRVSLLSVTVSGSSSSASTRRWLPEPNLDVEFPDMQRMVKRAKKPNAAASGQEYTIVYGPLGACLSVGTSDLQCTSPTFTPIFVDLYSANTTLPASTTSLLPDQFPLAPAGLFVSLLLIATQFLAVLGSAISMHVSKKGKAQGLAAKQPAMRKVATVAGVIGLAVMLAATLALRTHLSKIVEDLKQAGLGTASLGPAFSQFFAGAALEIVVLILLVAEAFTSR